MKSFVLLVLIIFCLGVSNNGHAACVFNTDSSEASNINFEDSNRLWEYLSKKSDCKIHKMFLGTFSNVKETEVLLFNYQIDPGIHGIINSSVAICKKDLISGMVTCSSGH